MKKVVIVALLILFLVGQSFAAEKPGTPREAQQLVKKAVAYIKANGTDKAFATFTNKKGPFIDRDLYIVVYNMEGKCLAHGFIPAMAGKDLSGMKDPDGKAYGKERLQLAKTKTSFWVDYKYPNPVTKKIEPKSMYHEVYNNMIVGCGVYKQK